MRSCCRCYLLVEFFIRVCVILARGLSLLYMVECSAAAVCVGLYSSLREDIAEYDMYA